VKVSYRKKLLKQLTKLPSGKRTQIERFIFEDLPKLSSLVESGKIEKMKGYENFYKARFGSYRVGMKLEDETLILQVVMDRKDIYKFFP
jgi:mRNA interferase RelE/StbE